MLSAMAHTHVRATTLYEDNSHNITRKANTHRPSKHDILKVGHQQKTIPYFA